MTRIDPYDVIAVEPDRFIQSQATRHVRPSWLAKQLGISTHELSRRPGVSVADLGARLDRARADTTAGLWANANTDNEDGQLEQRWAPTPPGTARWRRHRTRHRGG